MVHRLLKAQYFPRGQLLTAALGSKPSFTWRSIWGAREIIEQGSRWLIGNGEKVRVWTDRWLPRPYSFRPINSGRGLDTNTLVAEFIDKANGRWKEREVRETFLPCDAEIICSLPLCLT